MNAIEVKAAAKINLSIDVLGKRSNGYHDVRMIMQTISLYDRIMVEEKMSGIEIVCNKPYVPCDERNTTFKAAKIILEKHGITTGVKINISKNIPVSAGLAGGSTDAAAVLKGINALFSLGLDDAELIDYGKQVGADVPFCIKGGTMLSEGIGEILTNISPFPETYIVLVKPRLGVSTAWVYSNLNLSNIPERPDIPFLINAINEKNVAQVAKTMKNVLETVTIKKHPIIGKIKQQLLELGAIGSIMSGSGPTVFGLFQDIMQAENAYKIMKNRPMDVFFSKTTSNPS